MAPRKTRAAKPGSKKRDKNSSSVGPSRVHPDVHRAGPPGIGAKPIQSGETSKPDEKGKNAAATLSEAAALSPGLYLVATPIGNIRDITLRALDILHAAEVIACEDTRVTGKLLSRYSIETKMTPYHDHSSETARNNLVARIQAGAAIALVSDAGMPAVSDPGYKLVRACIDGSVAVTVIPGANAALSGLVVSGLPTDRFLFEGYLPAKRGQRLKSLAGLAGVPATLIFYESARRLAGSLTDMAAVLGERPAAVTRELTKLYEESRRGSLSELAGHYSEAGPPKGEIVVIVGPPDGNRVISDEDIDRLLAGYLETMSVRDAAQAAAGQTGLARRTLYDRALQMKGAKIRKSDGQ